MTTIAYLKLLRPTQWLKNLMLYFPPFLGGTMNLDVAVLGIVPFGAFCLLSSSTYIFNDLCDVKADQQHERKRYRPLASGQVAVIPVIIIALLLLLSGLYTGILISPVFLLFQCLYLVVTVSYSLCLKSLPIIDLFCIAAGFLFRLQAGAAVFGIMISEWLFLSVFLLAIFLSTGKRLCEKIIMGDKAGGHRKALAAYPEGFLEGALYMTGSAVLVTYTMYAISHQILIYSVPLCCFGLFRYIFRVKSGQGGDPTESLLRDPQLLLIGLTWALMVGVAIYGR